MKVKEPDVRELIERILPELDEKIENCYEELSGIEDRVSLELTGKKLMGVVNPRQIDKVLERAYGEPDHVLASFESKVLTTLRASLVYTLAKKLVEDEKFRREAPPEVVKEVESLVRERKVDILLAYSTPLLALAGKIYDLSSSVIPDREKKWGKRSSRPLLTNGF